MSIGRQNAILITGHELPGFFQCPYWPSALDNQSLELFTHLEGYQEPRICVKLIFKTKKKLVKLRLVR